MSRPVIENLRTWPRNLSTAQYGGLSTAQYGGLSTAQYGGMSTAQYGGMSPVPTASDNYLKSFNTFPDDIIPPFPNCRMAKNRIVFFSNLC